MSKLAGGTISEPTRKQQRRRITVDKTDALQYEASVSKLFPQEHIKYQCNFTVTLVKLLLTLFVLFDA